MITVHICKGRNNAEVTGHDGHYRGYVREDARQGFVRPSEQKKHTVQDARSDVSVNLLSGDLGIRQAPENTHDELYRSSGLHREYSEVYKEK